MESVKNYGFVEPTKEEITDAERKGYVFGGLGIGEKDPLNPSGDWREYLPDEETQKNNFIDSNGCTLFGTLNALEMLAKIVFDEDWNMSERFVGAFASMNPRGNNPHKVADTIRKVGLIPEELMPLTDQASFEELWDRGEANKYAKIGKKWLCRVRMKHDWVQRPNLSNALKFSPLGVSVYGWELDENGLYYSPEGARPTHWTTLTYIEDGGYEKENYMEIFDSYPPYKKKLRLDFDFKYIKRYVLEENIKRSWLEILRGLFR